jgi:hypothetical protein
MSTTLDPGGRTAGIVARAKAILLAPDREWAVIDLEPATIRSIYVGYIVILAAIPPAANFVHGVLFGYGFGNIAYHPSFFGALSRAVVYYAFSLVGVFLLALIIDALAPTFLGRKNQLQALKLVAYASTATWLAGIFSLVPGLGILGILALYSLYLFFTGVPVMMKSPPEKSLPYTAVIIVAGIVLTILAGFLSFSMTGYGVTAGRAANGDGTSYGTVTTPNGGVIPLDRLSHALRGLDASARQPDGDGSRSQIATETLRSFLPETLGGLPRTETSSAGGQFAGFGASSAEAVYSAGDKRITLRVSDLGAAGALMGLTGALGISGDQDTPTSYSRLSQKDGRTVAEEYDRTAQRGSYGVVISNRFMVHADGASVSMDELHQAVASVDVARLEALGK